MLSDSELEDAKNRVFINKDYVAYDELSMHYSDQKDYYNELPFSLMMIKSNNKYDHGYYEFFYTYMMISNSNKFDLNHINKFEKPERDYLIFLLNKGAKKESYSSREALNYYYKNGIGVEKNLKKADSLNTFLKP